MKKLVPLLALAIVYGVSCSKQDSAGHGHDHGAEHAAHAHSHGPDCGHVAVKHNGHVDYLDNGHLHNVHGSHVDEHTLAVSDANPAVCTPGHGADEHPSDHKHGADCGHAAVPHGDHADYLVNGHLHHPDGDHCDNHGAVEIVIIATN
ncbi:MAG TPA: hypothetical protein PKA41_05205 [Verrucomicrobiota bacterium]|nr:hypothetical protein [Verrucomicrobiota bacterium]